MEQLFKSKDGRIFTKREECIAADKEYDLAHAKELAKKSQREADAKVIDEAYKEYIKHNQARVKENKEELKKLNEKINEFIEKYGSYRAEFKDCFDVDIFDLLTDNIFTKFFTR